MQKKKRKYEKKNDFVINKIFNENGEKLDKIKADFEFDRLIELNQKKAWK